MQLLHDKQQEQLASPNLRSSDHERAALAQGGVGFQEQLTVLKQLKIDPIPVARNSSWIDMKREMLAHGHPTGLPVLQRFARLPDHVELIVAKRPLQRPIEWVHLRRRRSWLGRIGGDDQSAPNLFTRSSRLAPFTRLTRACGDSGCEQEYDPGESDEKATAHRLLRGVVARQRFQSIDPENRDAILFRLEN